MTLVTIQAPVVSWPSAPAPAAGPQTAPAAGGSAMRVRGATIRDMDRVGALVNGFARQGLMLPKSREQLCRTFREFILVEDAAGALLGCVALRVYTPELAEVSALAVAGAAQGRGVGRLLLERLTAEAESLGLDTLFALTLEEGFFRRHGYQTVDRSAFPLKIAADCATCPRRDACAEITMARRITRDPLSSQDGTQ